MAKINYQEGDWFAVPLEGGYAVGIVARSNPRAALLGYFFGPRRDEIPSLDELGGLRADSAILIGLFRHLGLKHGDWPILGQLEVWNRESWPMPVFVRHEELTGRSFRVIYDDDDPGRLVREELIPPGSGVQGPRDGLMGSGFVEIVLSRETR